MIYPISYYHGSPVRNIKVLQPHLDPRSGKYGIFISSNPILPMMFSLIDHKSASNVEYFTDNDRFIRGVVRTNKIHEIGYIYRVKPVQSIIQVQPLEFYIEKQEDILEVTRIDIDQVKSIGWEIITN